MTNKKHNEDKLKSREELIAQRLKQFGYTSNCLIIGDQFTPQSGVPTGIPEVDNILGDIKAIPYGTVVEFCGKPKSGKTYLAYHLIASAQKLGERELQIGKEKIKKYGRSVFFDAENTFVEERAKFCGINTRDANTFEYIHNIKTAEDYGELIIKFVETGEYDIVVLDSITVLMPEINFDKKLQENLKIGAHATFANNLLKKLCYYCSATNTIFVFINQFRNTRAGGAGFGQDRYIEDATGGKGVEYLTHMRLWLKQIPGAEGQILDSEGNIIGGRTKLEINKTRFGNPSLTAIFPVMYEKAISNPINEFINAIRVKFKDNIVVGKRQIKYFVDPESKTAEIITNNKADFISQLFTSNPPLNRAKSDKSYSAFEYFCNKLKYTEEQKLKLMEFIQENNKDIEDLKGIPENIEENNDDEFDNQIEEEIEVGELDDM